MKEDCAADMSAQQGCNDDTGVVEIFKEALKQRIGADRYRMWFSRDVSIAVERDSAAADGNQPNPDEGPKNRILIKVNGQFALDRLRKNFLRELRAAACQACGSAASVGLDLEHAEPVQAELPLEPLTDQANIDAVTALDDPSSSTSQRVDPPHTKSKRPHGSRSKRAHGSNLGARPLGDQSNLGARPLGAGSQDRLAPRFDRRGQRGAKPLAKLIASGSSACVEDESRSKSIDDKCLSQPQLPNLSVDHDPEGSADKLDKQPSSVETMTVGSFIAGSCNRLAYTAMTMACQSPASASPLFVCGPTGSGKTHLLSAIADQMRRRHRMRRVIHLSAEQFTNDFITSVGSAGISSFRRRYRDVDALLIDDVQFLGSKRATLREMLYTVETLALARRPLIFSGNQSPTEIPGLTRELAGRLAAGLICPMRPLDQDTRCTLLRRQLEQRCMMAVPEGTIESVNAMLSGDGRVVRGVANLVNTLQRMFGRMPTMDEIRQHGGDLLRAAKPVATLSTIEQAVCQTFQLPDQSLRAATQTRAVSQPRMLAMYLSRQLTSAAYTEIAGHFGGRSHSTAIAAGKNVRAWLSSGKPIGRGQTAMTAQEAIDRVESLLRSG